jgi:hypothetical protein
MNQMQNENKSKQSPLKNHVRIHSFVIDSDEANDNESMTNE